jgi:hypothetical protein
MTDLPSNLAVFTSGEAAYLTQMTRQMIIRCCNANDLGSYQVGIERRIPRNELIAFMRDENIPLDVSMQGTSAIDAAIAPPDHPHRNGKDSA